jgi:DNA-binding NtrC family response regulator
MLAQSPAAFRTLYEAERPQAAGEFPPPAKKSAARRVLVVDDEPLIRWSIAETLSANGYQIQEAADAETAVRAFFYSSSMPDVVLLDLRLPDCADLRLLELMRRRAPDAPVILMTAFGTPEVRQEAERLGAFCVLDKPFEVEELGGLVSRALASRH